MILVHRSQTGLCTVRRPEERPHAAGCVYASSFVDLHGKGNGQVRIEEVGGTDVDGTCDADLLP